MGAEVLKVEDPGMGDYARVAPPHIGPVSAFFHVMNRGKRSVVIDLKKDEGRELLLRLVRDVDIVFEQFRPGVLDRLGLTYEVLREARPDIILCSLSGYGQNGPLAAKAGHDINYQALAGTLWLGGLENQRPPVPAIPFADLCGSLHAVSAIVAALLQRERTGEGAWLDLAMADCIAAVAAPSVAGWTQDGQDAPGRGEGVLNGGIAQYDTYETKDGGYLAVGALEPKFFALFAGLAGHPEWMEVPPVPGPHQASLRASVRRVVADKTRDEWVELLEGVDCCVSPVLNPAEAARHPQFAARSLARVAGESSGPGCWVDSPLGPEVEGPAPTQGQHTDEVLKEWGFTPEDVADLRARGVVG